MRLCVPLELAPCARTPRAAGTMANGWEREGARSRVLGASFEERRRPGGGGGIQHLNCSSPPTSQYSFRDSPTDVVRHRSCVISRRRSQHFCTYPGGSRVSDLCCCISDGCWVTSLALSAHHLSCQRAF